MGSWDDKGQGQLRCCSFFVQFVACAQSFRQVVKHQITLHSMGCVCFPVKMSIISETVLTSVRVIKSCFPFNVSSAIQGRRKYCRLADRIVDSILESTAFVFPEMLPRHCALRPEEDPNKLWASRAVDQLIAMGMEMFTQYARSGGRRFQRKNGTTNLISKYMLPFKQRKLKDRICQVRRKNRSNNPIVYYLDKHRAPPLPIIDDLPEYPLRPLRERIDELTEPWRSLAVRGNAFFHADGIACRGQLVCRSGRVNAKHAPPPPVPRRCTGCEEPDFEKRYAKNRLKGILLTDCEAAVPERTRNYRQNKARESVTRARYNARLKKAKQARQKSAKRDVLATCMTTILDPTPTSSPIRGTDGDLAQISDAMDTQGRDPDDPISDPAGGAGGRRHDEAMSNGGQQCPAVELAAGQSGEESTPAGRKTLITDASDGEELVSVVNEEQTVADVGNESYPTTTNAVASATDTANTSTGLDQLTPPEDSVIEVKDEGGQLVVYVRGPGRPTLRVPVRAPTSSTRVLLPPSLTLQEAGVGRLTPGSARLTGIVAPTVRQQSTPLSPSPPPSPPSPLPPPSPPAPVADDPPPPELEEAPMPEVAASLPPEPTEPLAPESIASPPPVSAESPPPEPTASPPPVSAESPQPESAASPPPEPTESPAPESTELFPTGPTESTESPPTVPAESTKTTLSLLSPEDEKRLFKQPSIPDKFRRSPRLSKLTLRPTPPVWGVVTKVFSLTTSTTKSTADSGADQQSAADSGADASTGGAAASASSAAGAVVADSGVSGEVAAAGGTDTADAGAAGSAASAPAPASRETPSGSSLSGWPAPAAGLSLPDMMPPSLMTPLRPSSPPSDSSSLVFGFPTPSITPAPGTEHRDTSQSAHGLLETPVMPSSPPRSLLQTPQPRRHSPPSHSLLETPQTRHSPPRPPHTPPPPSDAAVNAPPPPPAAAVSNDSNSAMSLGSFFRRTLGDVRQSAAASAADGGPAPDLTSEQSLGGVLDALLTRRTGEPAPAASQQTAATHRPAVGPSTSAAAAAATAAGVEASDSAAPAPVPATPPLSAGEPSTEPTAGSSATQPLSAPAAENGAAEMSATPPRPSAATVSGGARAQGVRTRSEAASGTTPQRAGAPETKPTLPAEATEEPAAQAEEVSGTG